MNSKLKNKAKKSKLNLNSNENKEQNKDKVFISAKNDYLFSFRFDPQMWQDLHNLLANLNQNRLKSIKLSQLIRVLIKQAYLLNQKGVSKKLLSLL